MVCNLYRDEIDTCRIHLNDMKVYCPQSAFLELIGAHTTVSYTRDTMKYARLIGQYVIDLSC